MKQIRHPSMTFQLVHNSSGETWKLILKTWCNYSLKLEKVIQFTGNWFVWAEIG